MGETIKTERPSSCPRCGLDFDGSSEKETTQLVHDRNVGRTVHDQYKIASVASVDDCGNSYFAEDAETGNKVKIKLVDSRLLKDGQNRARFRARGANLISLSHQNILKMKHVSITKEGEGFIVSESPEGQTLQEIIFSNAPLSIDRAVPLFLQICDAVSHAHSRKLIHLNLRPDGILVKENSQGKEIACIGNFAPAETKIDEHITPLDATYKAPEQCKGDKLNECADVYLIGLLLYECLCGFPPFSGASAKEIFTQQMQMAPRRLSENCPGIEIPEELQLIVSRCLKKEPWKRYQSVSDLRNSLQRFLDHYHRKTPMLPPAQLAMVSLGLLLILVMVLYIMSMVMQGAH